MAKKDFRSKMEETSRTFQSASTAPVTSIPAGTKFVGDIETKSDVAVEGQIVGNISATGNVYVGKSGSVEGMLVGRDVSIEGTINGNVDSFGFAELNSEAKLVGDLQAVSINIKPGAYFKGKCLVTEKRSDNANDCLADVDNKVVPKKEKEAK